MEALRKPSKVKCAGRSYHNGLIVVLLFLSLLNLLTMKKRTTKENLNLWLCHWHFLDC